MNAGIVFKPRVAHVQKETSSYSHWSCRDKKELTLYRALGMTAKECALKLGRTVSSVRAFIDKERLQPEISVLRETIIEDYLNE